MGWGIGARTKGTDQSGLCTRKELCLGSNFKAQARFISMACQKDSCPTHLNRVCIFSYVHVWNSKRKYCCPVAQRCRG